MHVKHLIRKKCEVISPDVGVASVADSLLKNSFLLVMEQDKYLGVLTTSDIVENPYKLVIDCLRDKPRVEPECEVESVLALMKESQNSVLPVFKGDKLIGVVIQNDIADFLTEYHRDLEHEITQRKQTEDKLRQSENKYRDLVEEMSDVIYTLDTEGNVTSINKAGEAMFGREPQEVLGKSFAKWIPQEQLPDAMAAFKRVLGGDKITAETILLDKNGKPHNVEFSSTPMMENGKVVGTRGIIRDITERKKAEQALREEKDRAQKYLDIAGVMFLVVNANGTVELINRRGCEILGYREDEIIGKDWFNTFIAEPVSQEVRGVFLKLMAGKVEPVEYYENPVITKSGEERLIAWHNTILKDEHGNIIGSLSSAEDITEHKKAEQALQESQSRQRAILDSIPDIAWLKDTESRYIAANKAMCKAFDIKLEDLIGKTDFDISPEDLAKRYRADDQEVMKSGQRKRVEELWGKKEGERRWIETIKTPIYNDQGQVIGTSGIARDITERKKAEEQLREYSEKMARAERLASLGSLGAALAHEITQPLTVINLLIDNILTELETASYPKTVANRLRDVLTEVSRINSTAHKFRDAAKRSSERIITKVDLKAVAEKTLKLCDNSARRAKITLHLTDFDRLPSIYSSEEDLEQVFFALVDNAIQAACPTDQPVRRKPLEGGPLGRRADGKKAHQLVISGILKDKHVELQFSDNCGGIAPENLDKIFEPFFTTKPAGQAMGLGLCIVEHIVSRAGGKVHVESKPGEGTTFYITLPINIHVK